MKKLLTILLFLITSVLAHAQVSMIDVGTGEYVFMKVGSDHRVYFDKLAPGSTTYINTDVGAFNVIRADGGQYNGMLLHENGAVSMYNTHRETTQIPTADSITADNLGNSFTGNTYILCAYKTFLTIKDGNIYCWGVDMYDIDHDGNSWEIITAPTKMANPGNKAFTKIDHYTGDKVLGVDGELMCLASDGTVWLYKKNSVDPAEILLSGASFNARNICCVNSSAFVVETNNDKLYAWGYLGNNVGAYILGTTPVDITQQWINAGAVFPLKELVGNINTLHGIDSNDHLFGSGDNVQGEVGTGDQWPSWRTYLYGTTPAPFAWDFGHNERIQSVVQIPGRYKNLKTNNSLATYLWVQDMGNNWYSWGRNKGLCLGNGRTLNGAGGSQYPDWENIPAPALVTPLTTQIVIIGGGAMNDGIITFNPNAVQGPISNAGTNQYITTDTTTLYGQGSSQQEGTLTSYEWTQLSGIAATIVNPASSNTKINFPGSGTYVFALKVTNMLSVTDTSTVSVEVNSSNVPPVADAGNAITITLPVNTVSLNGNGTDIDGTIAAYQWSKVSGPGTTAPLINATAAATNATGLVQGTYTFELKVTDNNGAIARDSVQVIVLPDPNSAPVANAGSDITITLPTNTASLNGSGTDADGTISGYQWTKISGPSAGSLANSASASASANGLAQGVYKYELKVTDNNGATGKDTMQVTVNPASNVAPVANAGSDITITFPTSTASLNGSGTDTDGTITGYQWTKISGPSAGSLANATSASASANGLAQGVYKYELKVTDNNGATGKDTMQVTVNPAPNVAPVANAGSDIAIISPTSTALLNGSGTDADGTITGYQWTKISGPSAGSLANATSASASANGLAQGVYKYELKVTDNNGATGKDTVQITVLPPGNQAPTANAGSDITISLPTNTASLNGSGADLDGTISGYQWTKISGPSAGSLANANSASASANGLTQGIYKYELMVTDNNGAIGKDTIQVTVNPVPNIAPVANAGTNITITLPNSAAPLNGSATDADGTVVAYLWRVISGPAAGTISNATAAVTNVTGLLLGVYKFELRVTDNNGAVGRDTMQVTVNAPQANQPPVAHAGSDISMVLPVNATSLLGNGTDADGTVVGYRWRVISGSSQYVLLNAGNPQSTINGLGQGVYEVELTVTDNAGATGRDTALISVGSPRFAGAATDGVKVMPNPVQSILKIEILTSTNRMFSLSLFDARGVAIFRKDIAPNQNMHYESFDMSRFASGIYYIEAVFDGKNKVSKKVIKL